MIVLGIAPGIQTLAYSVLAYDGGTKGYPVDCDVLHAGRGAVSLNPWVLAKRARAHHLILGVVLERNPPAVVAVGPKVSSKEPVECADAIRVMVRALAQAFNVAVTDIADRKRLAGLLGERSLAGAVRQGLSTPLGSRDQRVLLATAIALAGAAQHRKAVEPQSGTAATL